MATPASALEWSIKESLIGYLSALEDGVISAREGAVFDGATFSFPLLEGSAFDFTELTGELSFGGFASLTGHFGAMRIELLEPSIVCTDGDGHIQIRIKSAISATPRIEQIAKISLSSVDGELRGTTSLTAAGRMLIGQQYQVGQELAPVRVTRG